LFCATILASHSLNELIPAFGECKGKHHFIITKLFLKKNERKISNKFRIADYQPYENEYFFISGCPKCHLYGFECKKGDHSCVKLLILASKIINFVFIVRAFYLKQLKGNPLLEEMLHNNRKKNLREFEFKHFTIPDRKSTS